MVYAEDGWKLALWMGSSQLDALDQDSGGDLFMISLSVPGLHVQFFIFFVFISLLLFL